MSKTSSQNLYCLIVRSLAGLKICLDDDTKAAKSLCEDCKAQLKHNNLCYKLLSEFSIKIYAKNLNHDYVLIDSVYQKILFVTTFMPLISPNTPLIKLSELEYEQEKATKNKEETYSISTANENHSKDRLTTSGISRKGAKSTPKQATSFKP